MQNDDGQASEASLRALFPQAHDRVGMDDLLTRELVEAAAHLTAGPVTPTIDLAAFRGELSGYDFRVPRQVDQVVSWTVARMTEGVVHVNHPRYFGLFNPSPTFPALCADRIAASFNPQLATWTTSPVPVEIEAHVIKAVAERARTAFQSGRTLHFRRIRSKLHSPDLRPNKI